MARYKRIGYQRKRTGTGIGRMKVFLPLKAGGFRFKLKLF